MRILDFNTLAHISDGLNKSGALWAIGASVMLYFNGLLEKPNDIDILVAEKDIEKIKNVLDNLGEMTFDGCDEGKEPYLTKYFYKYKVADTDIDLIAGFKIKNEQGIYEMPFDENTVTSHAKVNNVAIPLCALEDWYVLYQLMEAREAKVKLIEDYLIKNGIKNKRLLERALIEKLPDSVRCNIKKLID
ncbi:hypothetical protein HMPREF1982_01903 [Clostridiales bacterium oral taxon 876 str. F0540]|nr:hypothetical protein HMPREF1982_01903 [Clostridiales bacterium oral taxon 876 str. F0540]